MKVNAVNKKGYQSVKLYNPNDTLMGQYTKDNEQQEGDKHQPLNGLKCYYYNEPRLQ
jgi:hypothetical protein